MGTRLTELPDVRNEETEGVPEVRVPQVRDAGRAGGPGPGNGPSPPTAARLAVRPVPRPSPPHHQLKPCARHSDGHHRPLQPISVLSVRDQQRDTAHDEQSELPSPSLGVLAAIKRSSDLSVRSPCVPIGLSLCPFPPLALRERGSCLLCHPALGITRSPSQPPPTRPQIQAILVPDYSTCHRECSNVRRN